MSAISHLIAPLVTSAIQKIVVTVSFGLAPGELNFAYVYVDEYLELEGLQRNQVVHWNVQVSASTPKRREYCTFFLFGTCLLPVLPGSLLSVLLGSPVFNCSVI